MSDQLLYQWISIKFCVKLQKNSSGTFAVLSKVYAGEAMKSQVCLGVISSSRRVTRTWNMKEVVIHDFMELMKMLKKCRIWCIQIEVCLYN